MDNGWLQGILKGLGLDNAEAKIHAGLNNSSIAYADPVKAPTNPIITDPFAGLKNTGAAIQSSIQKYIAPSFIPQTADNLSQLWNSKLNPIKQIQAIRGMSEPQAQYYRNLVDKQVPRVPIPGFIQNYNPITNSLVGGAVNAIPNAVAGAAKLPAYVGPWQTAGDVANIAGGVAQGYGAIKGTEGLLGALTNSNSSPTAGMVGGGLHTPDINEEINDGNMNPEAAMQNIKEIASGAQQATQVPPTQEQIFKTPEIQQAISQFKAANPNMAPSIDAQLAKAVQTGNYRGLLTVVASYLPQHLQSPLASYLSNVADTVGGTIPNIGAILQGLTGR